MYSQNNEEKIILDFFKDYVGTFLDLGAYDGVDLSNTRALSERGWSGCCVEPNKETFNKLKNNYVGNEKIMCYPVAIGESDCTATFYSNDTYYSTLEQKELNRWVGTSLTFKKEEVDVITFNTFLNLSPYKKFDFITIDCEGLDYQILKQIDLNTVGCKLICVETNGKDTNKYIDYINNFSGFKVVLINPENLIMGR